MQPTPSIERLLAYLTSDDVQDRRAAAIELAQRQDERVIQALLNALQDTDSTVRANAASGLGVNGAQEAIDPLIARLQDEHDIVRERSATALAQIGTGRAIEPLIDALDDSGTWARNRIIYVLGASGDQRAVEPLLVQLNSDDDSTRGVAAWALSALGDLRAVDPLLELLRDPSASVRGNAAWGLGELGQARTIDALLTCLHDEAPDVRGKASWALGTLGELTGETRMVAPLIDLLDDYAEIPNQSQHLFVCQYAAEALTQIGTATALEAVDAWKPTARERLLPRRIDDLIRALQHPELETRERVFEQLHAIGAPAVAPLMTALTRHDHVRVRQGAAQALGELGDTSAVPTLITALADPDGGVWSQAVAALAKLGKPAERHLRPMLSSRKVRVKQGAAIALWRIAGEEKAFQLVLQAIQADDVLVRGSAITSLWGQPDARAVATLQMQLTQETGMMARYILQALQRIGTPAAQATIQHWLRENPQ